MPFATIKLRPGVNVEMTPVLNEAGISSSNLIRFRDGLAEKIGGWVRFYQNSVSGIIRALHAWQALNDDTYLGVGSTTNLSVITGGVLTDITPQQLTSDFTPDFSTTNGDATVTVDDPNILNVTTYDSVYFNTPVSLGGIILSGLYPIASVTGATTYTIEAGMNATATVAGGGAVPEFTTTSGSPSVSVEFEDHGLSVGDTFNFPIATTGDGVTIVGTYPVTSVTSVDIFVITADNAATSGATFSMNGGDAQIVYYITLGPSSGFSGYSIGGYSTGGYSTGTALTVQTGTPITATDWTLDNWGETLLASPNGGAIYYWKPNTGFLNAQLVSEGPAFNAAIFVSMQAQILVALGSTTQQNVGLDQDPLLVKWSSQLDFLEWTPLATNQAGSYRIPTGSKLVGGMAAPQQDLIWTDLDLWAMSYLGPPLVYGFKKIGSNCGLIAKHARTQLGAGIYWMGESNFFSFGNSAPGPIPCSVWDKVFQNLNEDHKHKCWAWSNTPFNEVWFFYPRASTGATECDAYVKLNTLLGVWDYGVLPRTAGVDQSVLGMPIAACQTTSLIYQHEIGYDDDGAPINANFETGWYALSEGTDIIFTDWFLPDAKWETADGANDATVQMTLSGAMYPTGSTMTKGPYNLTAATLFKNTRVRGRFQKFTFGSGDLGSFWRIGGVKIRSAESGRR